MAALAPLTLDNLAFGAAPILSDQPPGKTPHKFKTLYINIRNHLDFIEYPFEFSSPRSPSQETISKLPRKKMKSNLATSGLRTITSQVCWGESYKASLVIGNTSRSFVFLAKNPQDLECLTLLAIKNNLYIRILFAKINFMGNDLKIAMQENEVQPYTILGLRTIASQVCGGESYQVSLVLDSTISNQS